MNKVSPKTAMRNKDIEDDGILSPLGHQNSIYQNTNQSNHIINHNISAENTLEPPAPVDEKENLSIDKIDSLGMAAEDYRGLLQM